MANRERSILIVDLAVHCDLTDVIRNFAAKKYGIDLFASKEWEQKDRSSIKSLFTYAFRGSKKTFFSWALIKNSFLSPYDLILINIEKKEQLKYFLINFILIKRQKTLLLIDTQIVYPGSSIYIQAVKSWLKWIKEIGQEFVGAALLLILLRIRNKLDKYFIK